jgi:hypothetical protein
MTNLVVQSFGKENEYKRAVFTILSFYAYCSSSPNETRVILFTDKPNYFQCFLQNLPVEYVLLSSDKIRQMRGKIDFLHRMKIALIEEAFGMIDGNMLYADSDTFFIADPSFLVRQVSSSKCYMHLLEHEFESLRDLPLPAGKTFRAFVSLIESKSFSLTDGTTLQVKPRHVSWNAGVMMLHPTHRRFIPDVYTLTDQFYPPTQNHACEQYAFSIILQENIEVIPCNEVIYHYWYRVKKQIIDLFLKDKISPAWLKFPLDTRIAEVQTWTQLLPNILDNHVLMVRDNAIQAFNKDNFLKAYRYSIRAWFKDPFEVDFIKDILYHTKRLIKIQ